MGVGSVSSTVVEFNESEPMICRARVSMVRWRVYTKSLKNTRRTRFYETTDGRLADTYSSPAPS